MSSLYSIIPLLIILIPLIIRKTSKKEIVNGIFWGIISIIISYIVVMIPEKALKASSIFNVIDVSIFSFFFLLVSTALPEELSKFFCIKETKSKDNFSILMNAMLISSTFSVIEDFMYFIAYGTSISRMLTPGHILFELIMSFFLIKAQKNNKTLNISLAIIIPVLGHALFNTLQLDKNLMFLFYILGIVTYIIAFIALLKVKKQEPKEQKEIKFYLLKIITIIITIIITFLLVLTSSNSNAIKINEKALIQEENIELTINNVEKLKEEDFFGDFKDCIKVKITINNLSDEEYKLNTLETKIVDNLNKNEEYINIYFNNTIDSIPAHEEKTGYIYFTDNNKDYTYLIYSSGTINNKTNYIFNLK